MTERISVVFVCLGNICRSPLAEALFRHQVRQRGWEQRFEIDSAGTSAYHAGDPPDTRSAETARRRGVELTGTARQLQRADLDRFDYVVVMDEENLAKVERLRGDGTVRARIHRLREFDPAAAGDLNVPDPYFGGPSGFEDVHEMVERSTAALLDRIAHEQKW